MRRTRPRPAPPPLPRPADTPPAISETEQVLDEIALILEGQSAGGAGAAGGIPSGRLFSLASSPTLGTVLAHAAASYRIRGFIATPSVNIALTKNAMTVGAGGLVADAAGNILNAPLDIAGGQIVYVGTTPSSIQFTPLNIIVKPAETLYVSKNQNAQVQINMYYDIIDN